MSSIVAAGMDLTVTNGAFVVLESLHPCMPYTVESPRTTTFFFLNVRWLRFALDFLNAVVA